MKAALKMFVGSACALGTLAAGCADLTQDPMTAGAAYVALEKAVQACAETQRECFEDAAGDAAQLETCRADFQACAETEGQGPEEDLAAAAAQCRDEAAACREQSDDPSSCQDAMRTCLDVGGERPDVPAADGGPADEADEAGAVPQRACVEELHGCMEQDGEPRQCAADVRECLVAHVGGDASDDDETLQEEPDEEDAADQGEGGDAEDDSADAEDGSVEDESAEDASTDEGEAADDEGDAVEDESVEDEGGDAEEEPADEGDDTQSEEPGRGMKPDLPEQAGGGMPDRAGSAPGSP